MKARSLACGLALVLYSAGAFGEVAIFPTSPIPILGIAVEDPEPFNTVWDPLNPIDPGRVTLNADGGSRLDGIPDLWFDGTQAAVWAYQKPGDRDIAFAEWNGSAWSSIEFLTTGSADELDPRIFVRPDGTVYVTYWTGSGAVYLTSRDAQTLQWSTPELISGVGEIARRPSVAVDDSGVVWVAYERVSSEPGMARDVVVTQDGSGSFAAELVASTSLDDQLDPVVHSIGGVTWVDWIHQSAALGCRERMDGSWSVLVTTPRTDTSWIGTEMLRRDIQLEVLTSSH